MVARETKTVGSGARQPLADRFQRNDTWEVPTMAVIGLMGGLGPGSKGVATHWRRRVAEFWAGTLRAGTWLRDSLGTAAASADTLPRARMVIVQRAGLPMLAGTNMAGFRSAGFGLHAESAMCVAEGLSPLEALRTATLNPAKMLLKSDPEP